MVTKTYPVNIEIQLTPVGNPFCRIAVGDQFRELQILHPCCIRLPVQGRGPIGLTIEHYDKRDSDPTTALIIDEIKFDNISDPKFIWAGSYFPTYPSHMTGDDELVAHNYLSWNGVWQLDFTLPIYTWIHKTLDLGWIYD